MGCNCINYFPKGTKASDVEEFLLLLDFQRGKKGPFSGNLGTPFYYDKEDHYRHITGLYTELYRNNDNYSELLLLTRTTIWRSKFDSDLHNKTIRQMRKRFGGYFVSDYGRNRYPKFEGPVREKAEAGAYKAFSYLHSNIQRASHFIKFANLLDENAYQIQRDDFIDSHNPRIISANVLVPFLVSAIEDYFRSLYIALLRYSPKRMEIIQKARLQGQELAEIDRGELSVPEAVAKWVSFQNLERTNTVYKELNSKYDLHGILKRPYGRHKATFWEILNRLIEQRHALIHRAELNVSYKPDQLKRDIGLVEKALWRVYQELIKMNNWQAVERWEM